MKWKKNLQNKMDDLKDTFNYLNKTLQVIVNRFNYLDNKMEGVIREDKKLKRNMKGIIVQERTSYNRDMIHRCIQKIRCHYETRDHYGKDEKAIQQAQRGIDNEIKYLIDLLEKEDGVRNEVIGEDEDTYSKELKDPDSLIYLVKNLIEKYAKNKWKVDESE